MSIHHTAYIIVCNGCGKILQDTDGKNRHFSTNVATIQAARENGWLVNQKGDKDYCPDCKNKQTQEE